LQKLTDTIQSRPSPACGRVYNLLESEFPVIIGTFSRVNRNRGRSKSRRVLDLEPEIPQAVEKEPNVSCRRLALRMGVSSFTIRRTLHEQELHSYHLQRVQHLKPEDPPRRIAFCQWLLQKIDEEPNFLTCGQI
jgi:hypothetical protein